MSSSILWQEVRVTIGGVDGCWSWRKFTTLGVDHNPVSGTFLGLRWDKFVLCVCYEVCYAGVIVGRSGRKFATVEFSADDWFSCCGTSRGREPPARHQSGEDPQRRCAVDTPECPNHKEGVRFTALASKVAHESACCGLFSISENTGFSFLSLGCNSYIGPTVLDIV